MTVISRQKYDHGFHILQSDRTHRCELFDGKLNSKICSTHLNVFLFIEKEIQRETRLEQRSTI
jgi:uncharacterized protein (DUF1786 family)